MMDLKAHPGVTASGRTNGRILGHEGVGIIVELGPNVVGFHKGGRVLISCSLEGESMSETVPEG